jgi:hypothetical protein
MPHSDNNLCEYDLKEYWPKEQAKPFDIDETKTLEELGLYPACTLRMIRRQL